MVMLERVPKFLHHIDTIIGEQKYLITFPRVDHESIFGDIVYIIY